MTRQLTGYQAEDLAADLRQKHQDNAEAESLATDLEVFAVNLYNPWDCFNQEQLDHYFWSMDREREHLLDRLEDFNNDQNSH
jgi:hypothetical protein